VDQESDEGYWMEQELERLRATLEQERSQYNRALQKLEVQSQALAGEMARAEEAEAEVARLSAWVEHHQQILPGYQASVQRLSELEERLARVNEILAREEQQKEALRQELTRLRQGVPAPGGELLPGHSLSLGMSELQKLAFQDATTGLPNFHYGLRRLGQSLGQACETQGLVGLARIDVMRLRELNLVLGSQTCDEVLRQIGTRLAGVVGADNPICRGRDDEFWVLASCSSGGPLGQRMVVEQLTHIWQRFGVALRRPFEVQDHSLFLGFACGAVVLTAGTAEPGQILEMAGLALEASKQADPAGRLVFYDPAMEAPIRARMAHVPLLREALERGEMELFLQPLVELESLQIQGVESLLRWNHPALGQLLPAEFMPAALESGSIVALGEWVIQEVCRYSQNTHPYLWSLNVSAQELVQAHFVRRLLKAIEGAELADCQYLVVEISERGLSDYDRLEGALKQLRGRGIRLAIDDFSFDRVSLRRLQSLDISYLKISPQVTRALDEPLARNLVRGALLVAGDLGCKVVAEGVETMEQLQHLRELGCHWGQGHLLQAPGPVQDIWQLLAL
jgi:EAL domain-containing protein (putative c-di-GMP-specific phosphodiesterase class I)/GGDEF domain-containing protein